MQEFDIVNNLERFKNITPGELPARIASLSEPAFRARQIFKWVYQKRVESFDSMNNMPKALRERLSGIFTIQKLKPLVIKESRRGDAVKFGFSLVESPHLAESVLLYDDDRRTACLSSQLGCGLGCVFCQTGKMGFIRNLTQEEIIGQLIGINDYLASKSDKPVTNIVFMGMGEALSNFQNFRTSLEIIMHEDAFNIGGRRITVSTAGVIPSIEKLMRENLNVGLAISLNSFNNEQRSRLMPINKKYPIESLVSIAKAYYNKTGRRVTFEYVLIEGETDTQVAVDRLQKLLGGFPCKINLIPLNPSGDLLLEKTSEKSVERFSDELHRRGLSATIRKSRGADIQGACGQLAGRRLEVSSDQEQEISTAR